MAANDYQFVTKWRFDGTTIEEIDAILSKGEGLARWWPSVYLGVKKLEAGGPGGVGTRFELDTQGWLPYRLRWSFVVTRADHPRSFAIEAQGDFVGHGEWTIAPVEGGKVDVTYVWTISADKPLLKYLSFLFKPFFSLNHQWAMERGREGMELELRRRHGEQNVPAPRPPVPAWKSGGILLLVFGGAASVIWAIRNLL